MIDLRKELEPLTLDLITGPDVIVNNRELIASWAGPCAYEFSDAQILELMEMQRRRFQDWLSQDNDDNDNRDRKGNSE